MTRNQFANSFRVIYSFHFYFYPRVGNPGLKLANAVGVKDALTESCRICRTCLDVL